MFLLNTRQTQQIFCRSGGSITSRYDIDLTPTLTLTAHSVPVVTVSTGLPLTPATFKFILMPHIVGKLRFTPSGTINKNGHSAVLIFHACGYNSSRHVHVGLKMAATLRLWLADWFDWHLMWRVRTVHVISTTRVCVDRKGLLLCFCLKIQSIATDCADGWFFL